STMLLGVDKLPSTFDVTPPPHRGVGRGSVTLNCTYEISSLVTEYLFWYIQYPNESPKYLLRRSRYGDENAPGYKERFDASLNRTAKTVPLTVQNVQLSDSAVYYCALSIWLGDRI
uniref:Ig-like domain-containing protein n=1 Tax=Paramormyrops kingsleyae TaxID=1676925 RepID=A0A3B3Q4P1_9TELE